MLNVRIFFVQFFNVSLTSRMAHVKFMAGQTLCQCQVQHSFQEKQPTNPCKPCKNVRLLDSLSGPKTIVCAKPNFAARTFLLDPQGLQYSVHFAWIVHDQCEICWMEILLCVILAQGPCMHEHCFHLHLLARLLRIKLHWKILFGFLLSSVALCWRGVATIPRHEKFAFGKDGIWITGCCHHSPAWKTVLWFWAYIGHFSELVHILFIPLW